jgi:methylenetetrahydrofolate reductase (NADPH)
MTTNDYRKPKLLVVSRTPGLAQAVGEVMPGAAVDRAVNETEALVSIRQNRPDFVIIGQLGDPQAAERFAAGLREGWISRHSSALIVHPQQPELAILKQQIDAKLKERANMIKRSLLDPNDFCLIWEQIPGQGAFEMRQELVIENARRAAKAGRICGISVTDNPGGNPAISTDVLSSEIHKLGIEPLVHIAFRDKSRNQVESMLYQLAALDINNLLVLTGDYPSNIGFHGKSRPVFDLDAVHGLQLIGEMNRGMEHEIMRRRTVLAPTDFFAGVAFSPFKQEEAEVKGQYYKLIKKAKAGADFLITQVGYDARKLHELMLWRKIHHHALKVVATIYILTLPVARAMHDNHVPGCVVTDELLAQLVREAESPDKGRQARLDRAAKMYAIARGLGLSGVCISGQNVPYETVEYVIDRGTELIPKWSDLVHEFDYPQPNGFYYFERDPSTGLNTERPAPRTQKPVRPLIYLMSRAVHVTLFEPKSPLFPLVRGTMKFMDSSQVLAKSFGAVEFWSKAALYGCQNCGDCALYDVAYLCPVSQCPKNQRNAPCGGSFEGWCEVYPNERKCIWVRAYRRLKARRKEDSIGGEIVPPTNWELWQSSSWINYFLGRDHVSKREGITPVVRRPKSEAKEKPKGGA